MRKGVRFKFCGWRKATDTLGDFKLLQVAVKLTESVFAVLVKASFTLKVLPSELVTTILSKGTRSSSICTSVESTL